MNCCVAAFAESISANVGKARQIRLIVKVIVMVKVIVKIRLCSIEHRNMCSRKSIPHILVTEGFDERETGACNDKKDRE